MTRIIERERLPRADRRLGRLVNHDSESRRYAFRAPDRTSLHAVRHQRHVPVFDQGDLGSCTGNAAVGCMATGPFFDTVDQADADWLQPLGEDAAVRCYSEATKIDPWPGTFPPDDTGSDGLSVAKVLTAVGAISGYQHAFSLSDALAALMDRPLITGTYWTDGMFTPTAEGLIKPTGKDAGGHEYVVDGYDPVRGWVWFQNSWSASWSLGGRFAMQAEDYAALLERDGDVTVFVPVTAPAPVPTPVVPSVDDADRALWAADGPWALADGRIYRQQRRNLVAWAKGKGLA